VISILTLFTVIAAYRPVNKNVNTGAVRRAKRGQNRAGHYKLMANYQTGGYKTSVGLDYERLERKESDRSLSFMNTLTKSTQA